MKQQIQNTIFKGEKSEYLVNENIQLLKGGQAFIYFAIDQQDKKQVVVKEYFKDSSFQVDYEVLQKIKDKYSENQQSLENLITFYDQSSENQKQKFIVIEYCNEGDLFNYLIKKQKNVQTQEQAIQIIDIAIQITQGMIILNELNLAHRDLKPENILIHNNGKKIIAKISDYGLTKEVEKKLKSLVGTPNYMAPEILFAYQQNQVYDEKIDIWSFGLILYEMFTCQQLFKGDDQRQIFQKILNYNNNFDCPQLQVQFQEICQLVRKCLQKDPQKRPDFKQVQKELKDILQNFLYPDFSIIDSGMFSKVEEHEYSSHFIISKEQNKLVGKQIIQKDQQKKNQNQPDFMNIYESDKSNQLQNILNSNQQFTQQSQNYINQQHKQQTDIIYSQISERSEGEDEKYIEENKTQMQTTNQLNQKSYDFRSLQMRILEKIINQKNILNKYGYIHGVKDVDQSKFKCIVINDNIIQILSPIILQFILQLNDKKYLYNIKTLVQEQLIGKDCLEKQIDVLINLLNDNAGLQKKLFLEIILNLFQVSESSNNIFEIIKIFLNNLIQQQYKQNLDDVNQLIQQSTVINIQPNLELTFFQKYNEITIKQDSYQIIITNSFKSKKQYAVLVPHRTYKNLFQA
ncbi:hypothetical protein ABPG72_021846 [Tetrahymena utriculariae]